MQNVFIICPKGTVSVDVPFTDWSMAYFTRSMLSLCVQDIPNSILNDYECVELLVNSEFIYSRNEKTCRINSNSYAKVMDICPCDIKTQRLLKIQRIFGRPKKG